jgi:predicted enzyme related to lactoylglutathione lyase
MIKGVHAMFYSSEADALRDFIKNKLQLPYSDVGEGWLIFDLPEGDIGCHPTDFPGSPPSGTHNVSFYCDDIQKTVAELRGRGVKFDDEISDQGFGFTANFTMPGNVQIQLYQPKYAKRASVPAKKAKRAVTAAKKTSAKKKAAPARGRAKTSATARGPKAKKR